MKRKLLWILFALSLFACALCVTSCSQDLYPYDDYQEKGYTARIVYDANGGTFGTNTSVITDTYDLSRYTANAEGKKELTLFAPDAVERGAADKRYTASWVDATTGEIRYLAGWYATRTATTDPNGNVQYTYSDRWDFQTDKLLLSEGDCRAEEPALTLYAAWVPAFQYDFYLMQADGSVSAAPFASMTKNPTGDTGLRIPSLDSETGEMGARNDFPRLPNSGISYDTIYTDVTGTEAVSGPVLTHSGRFDPATATLQDPVMKVYCSVREGKWYVINSVDQFISNVSSSANLILDCDLDFADAYWPSNLPVNTFSGTIIGNGHTIRNVTVEQRTVENNAMAYGLFGKLADGARLENVTFDGITVKITAGSRVKGTAFGVLAGVVAEGANLSHVTLKNSTLVLTRGLNIMHAPVFGLVTGSGAQTGITFDLQDLTLAFTGEGTDDYDYQVNEDGRFQLVMQETA